MKPIGLLFTMIVFACLSLNNMGFAQTTHTITLNVNTGTITKDNVDEVSNFGQGPGIANRDFTITVKNGDTVRWIGVSSDKPGSDRVEITGINHEGGARVFGRNKLNDVNGVVTGVVTEGKAGDEEKYKISFKAFNNGVKRKGTFHIDPKIKVN